MSIHTVNPATGKPIATHKYMPKADVFESIQNVHQAFLAWRATNFNVRKIWIVALKLLQRIIIRQLFCKQCRTIGSPFTLWWH